MKGISISPDGLGGQGKHVAGDVNLRRTDFNKISGRVSTVEGTQKEHAEAIKKLNLEIQQLKEQTHRLQLRAEDV